MGRAVDRNVYLVRRIKSRNIFLLCLQSTLTPFRVEIPLSHVNGKA